MLRMLNEGNKRSATKESFDDFMAKKKEEEEVSGPVSKMTWSDVYEKLVSQTKDTERADELFGRLSQDYPEYKWKDFAPTAVVKKLSKL